LAAQPAISLPARGDESLAQDTSRQGSIALHLRVGVTGHRNIDVEDEALKSAVREALARIGRHRAGTTATSVSLTVVSALAEGADRLVASEAMDHGASLEVVLPLPVEDYLTDFASEASKSDFRTLLKKAAAVTGLPVADERDKAYERAGRAVVDRSDVLIALWDGHAAAGRGGTAQIVAYARLHQVPVLQVPVKRLDQRLAHPRDAHVPEPPAFFGLLSDRAFELLDRYNSGWPRTEPQQAPLLPPGVETPVPAGVRGFVDYVQPYFDRAEQVAGSLQRLFRRLTLVLYGLSAAAVILVATQIIFFPNHPWIVWFEVGALAAVVVTLVIGRWTRLHDRWLAARYLAERIRSGVFLAAVGAGDLRPANGAPSADSGPPDPGGRRGAAALLRRWVGALRLAARNGARIFRAALLPPRDDVEQPDSAEPDPNQEWVERAFHEIYWRARRSPPPESELEGLRALLVEAWVEDQIKYHRRVSRDMSRRQLQLGLLAVALFGVSALAALFHSTRLIPSASNPDFLGYFSIVIPAVGAAISGYSAQREYARLAQRSRQMMGRLNEARQQIEQAEQLSALQRAARRTELLMRSETADWYAVFRLRDFELPS
jgi:SMODS and SLOG-associating 2TM effector domain 1